MMQITKQNFIIPYFNEAGEVTQCFIEQPVKTYFDTIAGVLGYLYTKIRSSNLLPEVFVMDYSAILKDIVEKEGLNQDYLQKVENFLDRALTTGWIINEKGEPTSLNDVKLDDDTLAVIKGYLLFTSALLRYTPVQMRQSVLGQLLTSQTAMEWQSSFQKSAKEETTTSRVRTKVKSLS